MNNSNKKTNKKKAKNISKGVSVFDLKTHEEQLSHIIKATDLK